MKLILNQFKMPSWNEYNSRSHWAKAKKKNDEIYWLVYEAIKNSGYKDINDLLQNKKVKLIFEIHYKGNRRHDPDNSFLKPIIDGIVKCGLLRDDSTKEIKEIIIRARVGQKENKVIIDILPIKSQN